MLTIYMENPEISVGKSNVTRHSIWSTSEKLWASGQSEAFLLLRLGFTADVHTFCTLSIFLDKLNHFIFKPEHFHLGGLCKW